MDPARGHFWKKKNLPSRLAEWHFETQSVWRAGVIINGWLIELVLELEGGKVQDKTWNRREIQSGSAYFEKLFVRQITCSSPFTRLVFDSVFT